MTIEPNLALTDDQLNDLEMADATGDFGRDSLVSEAVDELRRTRAERDDLSRQLDEAVQRGAALVMERDAAASSVASGQRDYLEIADAVCRESGGPSEVAEIARRTRQERDALVVRRDDLLALTVKLTRETPYPADLDECRSARAALIAEVGTLRAKLGETETERDAYRAMLCDLLASAHPHPVEHPTMARQWDRARRLLRSGPPAPPWTESDDQTERGK